MTVYFEGDGKSRPVTLAECRDQFVFALKEMRDELLNDPALESFDDTPARDLYLANRVIGGVLDMADNGTPHFPAINLIACIPDEDVEEAKAAGANYLDLTEFANFGSGLAEYWNQVSN